MKVINDHQKKMKLMKTFIHTVTLLVMMVSLSSCFKNYDERYHYTAPTIEFENAVSLSKAVGKNYPILPAKQKPSSGVVKYRVNLFGTPPSQDVTLSFGVVTTETTALEGTDYRLPNGTTFTVSKGSSFGYVEVEALNTITGTPLLVLELTGTDKVKTADLYKTIGISFAP
jgi:hypothetical protein